MKSDADFWINDTHDGRWWHTVESKGKGFTDVMKGERKFATCHGSYICKNDECTKWLTENVQNRIDFRQEREAAIPANLVDITLKENNVEH